ncbi:hypothetical protein [Acaryochloris sp. IP29b_bin.137]|uniref:hypothetical protein n=1 Tax=Acaryochloris sp. IP29b_bin.137 TaxID=2969217 RepID=UPI002638C2BF|nr:hypothetical protein [Acaryochloris sp. IP29b_bin.137]
MDVDQTKILKLAQQGNQQAIAVVLNRHLMPKGAHIKVKHKDNCLQILLHTPQKAQQSTLIQMLREQLMMLRPAGFIFVKVYNPHPGKKTASLIHEFSLDSATTPSQTVQKSRPAPNQSSPVHSSQRSSVAEVLLHMSSLDDLKVLQDHPFFTGKCPQCNSPYIQQDPPPVYWDCPECGWEDNLSQFIPETGVDNHAKQKNFADSKKLGNYLMEAGLLTSAQIEVALADQQITGMRLGEVLVRRGWVKEETIEYLMQKVILPERTSTQDQSSSYLELSRKLLKTLMSQAGTAANVEEQPQNIPVPSNQPNRPAASERATLVLPDADVSDYLDDFPSASG